MSLDLNIEASNATFNYKRRKTIQVKVGNITIGGDAPIRTQSMANTDTNNIEPSVEQCIRIINAGGELVRYTTQGVKEANNLKEIHDTLRKRGYNTPIVADIHFNPQVAYTAAKYVEKVRINPGNFVDSVHTNKKFTYTDEEYQQEIEKIRKSLIPLLDICKENETAIRIGVNHGSLSDRILSRYGDTPEGMVESCLEFLRICRDEHFSNIVISIKASNVVVMVKTVRLLAQKMDAEGLNFPIHLGVTEAGDGEDGRIKSAAGIGALLLDGIGDTIRVSLSEDPEAEIPVAKKLVEYVNKRTDLPLLYGESSALEAVLKEASERPAVGCIGGGNPPVVITKQIGNNPNARPDFLIKSYSGNSIIVDSDINFIFIDNPNKLKECGSLSDNSVILFKPTTSNIIGEVRSFVSLMYATQNYRPIIPIIESEAKTVEELQLFTAAELGALLIDKLIDGICLISDFEESASVCYGILQATRRRIFKTEFISCPSCGRTLYNMQSAIAKIKAATSHLKGLKIAIMGCIVNGPGEMADADYGYIGAGRGTINLYKGKNCIEKLVPEEDAVEKLIQLIKENGDWQDLSQIGR